MEVDKEMLKIVECPICHQPEYYGAMIWHNGHTECRSCTYIRWHHESEIYYVHGIWTPGPEDYTFPFYSDGINYTSRVSKVYFEGRVYDVVDLNFNYYVCPPDNFYEGYQYISMYLATIVGWKEVASDAGLDHNAHNNLEVEAPAPQVSDSNI